MSKMQGRVFQEEVLRVPELKIAGKTMQVSPDI